MKKILLTVVAVVFVLSVPASAIELVYEPFAYADGWLELDGCGGAKGTVGTWNTSNTVFNDDWRIHQEGELSGVTVGVDVYNTFDGTVANLATMGGYVGTAGPEDIGEAPDFTGEPSRWMAADIGLDPSVTARFGTTDPITWISYVSARGWYKNEEHANLTLGTIPAPDQSRGDNYGGIGTGGDGFGTGGGPTRNNRYDIYPMFYDAGQYVNSTGLIAGNSYGDSAHEVPDADAFDLVEFRANGDFGPPNIVIMKIEWDADGGADILSVVRFLEDDVMTEAAFDALIAATPNLSSANWDIKPDIDQTTLDTLTFMGVKVFVDEIRLGTTFDDVTVPEPMTIALLGLGGLGLIRRKRK